MNDPEPMRPSERFLVKSEEYIYITAGYILVFAAAGLVLTAVYEMAGQLYHQNYTAAMVHLLDRILLVLMLAEIIYTIERIARTRRLEATPFLIVGIIAAVRRVLIITAESVTQVNLDDSKFQGILAELGLLSVMILLLSISLLLIHKPNQQPEIVE